MSQNKTWVCYNFKQKYVVHPTEGIYLHPVVGGVPAEEGGDLPGAPGHRGQGDAGRAAHPPPHHLQPIRGERARHTDQSQLTWPHLPAPPSAPPSATPSTTTISLRSELQRHVSHIIMMSPTHLNIGRPRFSTQPSSLCSMWIWWITKV